ncbi:MAG: response regulator [Bacteroidota bacterium]
MTKNKTILIVDDSESIRYLLKQSLEKIGFNTLLGCDGSDALQYFDGREIDFVITDYHMPNLDGISMIKEVRSRSQYQYLPIILLTTETQINHKNEARQAGATGWMVKPFNEEKLMSVIRKVMR